MRELYDSWSSLERRPITVDDRTAKIKISSEVRQKKRGKEESTGHPLSQTHRQCFPVTGGMSSADLRTRRVRTRYGKQVETKGDPPP